MNHPVRSLPKRILSKKHAVLEASEDYEIEMKSILGLLFGFEILDGLLTHLIVGNGIGEEANPFLRSIVLGDNFLLFKICGGILVVFLLWAIYTRWPRVALVCSSSFVVFYELIVAWNLSLLFQGS